jgi:hypothetical protein
LLSDIFGVAVFDPNGRLIIANRDIHNLCTANAISLDNRNIFVAELAPMSWKKATTAQPSKDGCRQRPSRLSEQTGNMLFKGRHLLLSVAEKNYTLFILSDITKIKEVGNLKGQISVDCLPRVEDPHDQYPGVQ